MLLAVNFNVPEMIALLHGTALFAAVEPRKARRLEGADLRAEHVPPASSAARRHHARAARGASPSGTCCPMLGALGLTLFYGFSSGTRNVFAGFLVTFLIGYSLAAAALSNEGTCVLLGSACALVMCFATYFMLQFRTVGLRNYLRGNTPIDAPDLRNADALRGLQSLTRFAGWWRSFQINARISGSRFLIMPSFARFRAPFGSGNPKG